MEQSSDSHNQQILTLRAINRRNREFWDCQRIPRERLLANEAVAKVTMARVDAEYKRYLPIRFQSSFDQLLADSERDKNIFKQSLQKEVFAFCRRGGSKPKTDTLQVYILEKVRRDLSIKPRRLPEDLRQLLKSPRSFVRSIDSNAQLLDRDKRKIHFEDHDGSIKKASVAGLKDRLLRARKKSSL